MSHGLRRMGACALLFGLVLGLFPAAPAAAGGPGWSDAPAITASGFDESFDESEYAWESRFFGPGLDTGTSPGGTGGAHDLVVWDDGTVPALYVGGWTITAGPYEVNRIARWDGERWSPLSGPDGTGVWMEGSGNPSVKAIAVYDGALVAAGFFDRAGGVPVNNIARWDGSEWSALDAGLAGGIGVEALTVHDGELYASGSFTTAGGEPANRVARWDGDRWSPVGSGIPSGYVYALDSYQGELVAGGSFTEAGGVAADRIAGWDGERWSAVGGGMDHTVRAFTVFSDGEAADGTLVAGGSFTQAGGVAANRIASWDGTSWSPLGAGMSGGRGPTVFDLTVFDGAVVAGGAFREAGDQTVSYIARWDGGQWSPLAGPAGTGMDNGVGAVAAYGGALIAGSSAFRTAGGVPVNYIARWDETGWSALADGGSGLARTGAGFATVRAMTIWDGALVVAGVFAHAGGQRVDRVAVWDGATWTPLPGTFGTGTNGSISALAVYQGDLIAGGSFDRAGGLAVDNLARFDGSEWSPMGTPTDPGTDRRVKSLAVHDGSLYAGGSFTTAGGVPASYVARWDGGGWSAVGGGMNGSVNALTIYNGELVAGGAFRAAGGQTVNYIARWDGRDWAPVSGGVDRAVYALTEHAGALYAGGDFIQAGGATANRVARWDGDGWSALAGADGTGTDRRVESLTSFAGSLIVGGQFTEAGGLVASAVVRWDGEWSPLTGELGEGVGGVFAPIVSALLPFDADGDGPVPEKLAAGGRFHTAGGLANWGIAMHSPTEALAHLTVSPSRLEFETTPAGQTAGPATVTLTATGNQPVDVTSLPAPEPPFEQVGRDCPEVPFTLAPNGSCTIDYAFTPTVAGSRGQTVTFANSGTATAVTLDLAGTGLAAPPGLGVVPERLALALPAGGSDTRSVTIDNRGEADLEWRVLDESFETAAPVEEAARVEETGLVTRGGEEPAGENEVAGAEPADNLPSGTSQAAPPAAGGSTVLTHSEAMEVQSGRAIACQNLPTGHTRDNRFLRTFALSDFDISDDFLVTDVTFGVQLVRPGVEVTVNLYTLDGFLSYDNLTPLASQEVTLAPEQAGQLVTVPVQRVVPAGATLVAELAASDLLGTGWFFPGANDRGERAPSYFSSDVCGYPEPTPMANVGRGNPDVHLAMSVTGRDPVDCALPEWLETSPASGSVAGGDTGELTVSVDASGLAPGEYPASVCLTSNDPARSLVEVPVALTVEAGGCDETITGTHEGALTVSEGVTCLAAGARVLGEVNVREGAGLVASSAAIQGPVSAVGATVVEVAFSQITGPVLVSGATGSVSLFATQVTGSVGLVNNQTGDSAATVSGNTIIGSLSCFGNRPPPTDHGLSNTATGGSFGQCADL